MESKTAKMRGGKVADCVSNMKPNKERGSNQTVFSPGAKIQPTAMQLASKRTYLKLPANF